jgi:hypothetical protein
MEETMQTITITREERNTLRKMIELIEGACGDLGMYIGHARASDTPPEQLQRVNLALHTLDLIGWQADGDRETYAVDVDDIFRDWLREIRLVEEEALEQGEAVDPEHTHALAQVSDALLARAGGFLGEVAEVGG